MKNWGSTPILTNSVEFHPRNIHTKFEANPCCGSREEVEKPKKVHADDDDNKATTTTGTTTTTTTDTG